MQLPGALTVFAFFVLLSGVAFADMETMEIPDGFHIALVVIGIISVLTMPEISVAERLIGVCSVSVPMLLVTVAVPGAFGGGDIKLMGACGLFLGWKKSIIAMFLAILAAGIYGIYLLSLRRKGLKDYFAFGPFLCTGMAVSFLWGERLLYWYLDLCGF